MTLIACLKRRRKNIKAIYRSRTITKRQYPATFLHRYSTLQHSQGWKGLPKLKLRKVEVLDSSYHWNRTKDIITWLLPETNAGIKRGRCNLKKVLLTKELAAYSRRYRMAWKSAQAAQSYNDKATKRFTMIIHDKAPAIQSSYSKVGRGHWKITEVTELNKTIYMTKRKIDIKKNRNGIPLYVASLGQQFSQIYSLIRNNRKCDQRP